MSLLASLILILSQGRYVSCSDSEVLAFSDTFSLFNFDIWEHEITAGGKDGGSWEFQYFTNNRTNSYVKDGQLYIQPTLTSDLFSDDEVTGLKPATLDLSGSSPADLCTSNAFYGCTRSSNSAAKLSLPPVQSASLRTVQSFSFRYGRLEISAKLPRGNWIKPTITLLPVQNVYGGWPASGEISLVQSRGNNPDPSNPIGSDTVSSVFHWGPHYTQDKWFMTQGQVTLTDNDSFSDNFHTFGLYWDEDKMYTYIDDDSNRIIEVSFKESDGLWNYGGFSSIEGLSNPWEGGTVSAPFDQKFYISMSVAVGGVDGYFPDGVDSKPWSDSDSTAALDFFNAKDDWYSTWEGSDSALRVDSIKVWQDSSSLSSIYYQSSLGTVSGSSQISSQTPANVGFSQFAATMLAALVGLAVGVYAASLAHRASKRMTRYQEL